MVDLSQTDDLSHEQQVFHRLTPDFIQLQQLTLSQSHELEQLVHLELSQNPALELEPEPTFLEDMEPEERDDDWNQDCDKPLDEYETGDSLTPEEAERWDAYDISSSLEQAALGRWIECPERLDKALEDIRFYRFYGYLPDDADPQLHKDLAILERSISYQSLPSIQPTFKVTAEGDLVEARVVPGIAGNLKYRTGLGRYSDGAKKFIQMLDDRLSLLNSLASHILEDLQADFFRQPDRNTALRYLIPIPPKKVPKLGIKSPFNLDEKYLSKASDLPVSCNFGPFSFGFFLQSKAALVRLWVSTAYRAGIKGIEDQNRWIKDQIQSRSDKWDSEDRRHEFIKPLLEINVDDIKNARRSVE